MESYILSELTVHNFGPFKGTHVLKDVHNKNIIGIIGEYYGIKGKSNRSGKSMLLEVFTYLFTGKSRADTEAELIHNGEDVMYVQGVFIDEYNPDNVKTIKRGRSTAKQNSGLLEVDWIEKSKDAKQAIIDTFGVDPDDFEITAFFKQADIEGFMKKKPAQQSEDMMKWMDNGHWPLKGEEVKKDLKAFRDRLKDLESAKRALESSLDSPEAIQIDIDKKNKEADALDDKLQDLEAGLEELNRQQKEAEEKRGEYNAIKQQLVTKVSEANKNEREINRIKKHISDYDIKLTRVNNEIDKDFQGFDNKREDVARLSEELGGLDSKMSHIKGLMVGLSEAKGLCPILKTKCDLISSKDDMAKYQSEHDELLSQYNEKKNELRKTKRLIQLLGEVDEYNDALDGYEKELGELGYIDVSETQKEIQVFNKKIQDEKDFITENQRHIDRSNNEADAYADSIKNLESDIKVLEHRLEVYDETIKKINEKEEMASRVRIVIDDLSYIAMMFSKYGIPADEIDNSLGTIQDKVNMILKLAGLDLSMYFSPDKEIGGKEPVCICGHQFVKGFRGKECPECGMERQNKRKTEMTIKIIEKGKERKFKMDSGGGKTLIAFAVRIAINLIKREQGKMKLNMLFLDEVDAPFDDFHLDKLVNIITKTLVQSFNYSQIILISHNTKIRDSIDDIVKVVRYSDDTSKLSFVS